MMQVQMTPELEQWVRSSISEGRYHDESELLEKAVYLLRQRDALQRDIQVGLDELDRGEYVEADEVFSELEKRIQDR